MFDVIVCLLAVGTLILIPRAALNGDGYRGVYLAGVLVCGALGFLIMEMVNAPLSVNASEAERIGDAAFNEYGFPLSLWCFVAAFASAVGAALWKPATKTREVV